MTARITPDTDGLCDICRSEPGVMTVVFVAESLRLGPFCALAASDVMTSITRTWMATRLLTVTAPPPEPPPP